MKDFTVSKYQELLESMRSAGYSFQTFEGFLRQPDKKSIMLRHDVDLLPYNSLRFAEIQHEAGVKGSYYFRAVKQSWDEAVIRRIADLGHEVGYHYECLTTCHGDMELALKDFEKNLEALRKLTPVSTICMHGSPMSKYDSKDLWKSYDYKSYDLIGEPYFDVDFQSIYYLTDTGRRWDGDKVSVRDKVKSGFDLSFHNTADIIDAFNKGEMPEQIMFTFHPQRWNDSPIAWLKELVLQKTKNVIKRMLYVRK